MTHTHTETQEDSRYLHMCGPGTSAPRSACAAWTRHPRTWTQNLAHGQVWRKRMGSSSCGCAKIHATLFSTKGGVPEKNRSLISKGPPLYLAVQINTKPKRCPPLYLEGPLKTGAWAGFQSCEAIVSVYDRNPLQGKCSILDTTDLS